MMVESFLRYIRYEKNYSSHTVISYKNDLLQFEAYCAQVTGEFDPLSVDLDIVRNWMVSMAEEGVQVSSVKRKVSALRSFFKYLKREGKITESPLCLLSMPKTRKKLPVYVREDQMDFLIDDIDFGEGFRGVRDRLLLTMLYTTGMRRSELIGLRDDDVDFFNSVIRVTGKGNKQRLIPFGRELLDLMKGYLDCRSKEIGKTGGVFLVKEDGDPMYAGLVYQVVRKYLALVSSLAKRSPHVLRHSFATAMLKGGAELTTVKELLGHSTLSSTEVYTHVSPKEIMMNYNQAHPRANKEKGGQDGN
ncbi:MAG: tyrosine-type recombinase/integrase [Bacteroidales bacterium]